MEDIGICKEVADSLGIKQDNYLIDTFSTNLVDYAKEAGVTPNCLYGIRANDIRYNRLGRFCKKDKTIYVSDFYPISLIERSKRNLLEWLYYKLNYLKDTALVKYIKNYNNLKTNYQNILYRFRLFNFYTCIRSKYDDLTLKTLLYLYRIKASFEIREYNKISHIKSHKDYKVVYKSSDKDKWYIIARLVNPKNKTQITDAIINKDDLANSEKLQDIYQVMSNDKVYTFNEIHIKD